MGEAITALGWPRPTYIVSTSSTGAPTSSTTRNTFNRKYLIQAMDGSLRRLGLDFLDLIFCHVPTRTRPIEETVRAMHDIIASGHALYWGTSEWTRCGHPRGVGHRESPSPRASR